MDKSIEKMWCIHTVEYHSASRRKEILTLTAAWMNLEDIAKQKMRGSVDGWW